MSPSEEGLADQIRPYREEAQKNTLDLGLSQSKILERLGFPDQLFRSNISQCERLAKIDLAILIDDHLDLPGKDYTVQSSEEVQSSEVR